MALKQRCQVFRIAKGASIPELAKSYFDTPADNTTDAITNACRSIYGKLIQTASWGLSALQSLTLGSDIENLDPSQQRTIRNLPSRIYYGVNADAAIDLSLLGVPRRAAQPLADSIAQDPSLRGIADLRSRVANMTVADWQFALGAHGETYHPAWRVIEGRE